MGTAALALWNLPTSYQRGNEIADQGKWISRLELSDPQIWVCWLQQVRAMWGAAEIVQAESWWSQLCEPLSLSFPGGWSTAPGEMIRCSPGVFHKGTSSSLHLLIEAAGFGRFAGNHQCLGGICGQHRHRGCFCSGHGGHCKEAGGDPVYSLARPVGRSEARGLPFRGYRIFLHVHNVNCRHCTHIGIECNTWWCDMDHDMFGLSYMQSDCGLLPDNLLTLPLSK